VESTSRSSIVVSRRSETVPVVSFASADHGEETLPLAQGIMQAARDALNISITLTQLFRVRRSAKPLQVGNSGELQILRQNIELLDRAIQKLEFFAQGRMALRWQCIYKIYNHCTHPACDLHVRRPVKADFAESQMNKIFPVRRAKDHAGFSGSLRAP